MTDMTTTTTMISVVRKQATRDLFVRVVPLLVLVALVAAVALRQPNFVSAPGIRGLLESMAPILLLAIGQMFVILTGGIDLSFAVIASFTTVLIGLWIGELGAVGVLLAVLVAALVGFFNGIVVAFFQIPSFIVTLGTLGLLSGLGLLISGASTVRISQNWEIIGWITDLRVAQMPVSGILAIAVAIIVALVLALFSRGNRLHAMGLAEPAVLMSGGSTLRARVLAFTLSGLFAGFAAVVLAASQHAGGPTLADTLQLPAIAAVIVGGTAITGGVGGPIRTIIGALIIVVLRVGLTAMGVPPTYEQIVYGVVIIGAVLLTIDRSRLKTVK
ncbi:ABC transporter permease [Microbacterium sp. CFH 90308]|uniref:ABC transporter permease n=1 Tax=Microbacterium salsuginis TaxID=2722803 RepID=A0ABX1KCK8_9MICO|nr:ABC transporter permease [Microbacterium sp. CFH 90308]NLP84766.1 ABC transporter permease [Microbacterium sp. CFH 90308]